MTFDRRASTATQLSLPLDGAPSPLTDASGGVLPSAAPGLPAIDIAPEWKEQQRLWGPALHPMCSYLASFPAALAHAFIGRYSRRGDVVLDPFSGRGTTPLQACAEGRIGVGNDLNPFAHLLTAAKVEPAAPCRDGDPGGGAPARLGAAGPRNGRRSRPRSGRSPTTARSSRSPGPARTARPASASRRRSPWRSTSGHSPSCSSSGPSLRLDDPTDRFLAAALTGHPPRQERVVPVAADAEHVQHGPALRPRVRLADGLRRRRSGTSSTASSGSWPASSAAACRPRAGSRSWATHATPPAASGPSSAVAGCRTGHGWS